MYNSSDQVYEDTSKREHRTGRLIIVGVLVLALIIATPSFVYHMYETTLDHFAPEPLPVKCCHK